MEGSTDDLTSGSENSGFACAAHEIVNKIMDCGISKREVVQCIGIKRTNANDLSSIDIDGGVTIYPTYALMNSNCYCNTRCEIDPKTFVLQVRAQKDIKKNEEITTRYFGP